MLPSVLLDAAQYAASAAVLFFNGNGNSSASSNPAVKACQLLEAQFPSLVSFPGSVQFESNIRHWANTSSQIASCSIEPETADDVSSILRIVGREDIRSPFAIRSGGHALNAGFSSTEGVQISMAKFSGLTYDAPSKTVTIGVGMTWGRVYAELEPLGVGGLTLGGGFSWKTDQYGLTIDSAISYSLVLPSGQQVHVSNSSYPDLFFGLKGGLNNFGIVTDITFETHPQTLVYGGGISYSSDMTDAVNAAVSNFSMNNRNTKALILASYLSLAGHFSTFVILFYDGPNVPSGIFDEFLSIPSEFSDIKKRTFCEFMSITSLDGAFGIDPVGFAGQTVPITHYPTALLSDMVMQTKSSQSTLAAEYNSTVVFAVMMVEPFVNPFAQSRGGAYPHLASRPVTPSAPIIGYKYDSSLDPDRLKALHNSVVSASKQFKHNVQTKAVEEGVSCWDDILYPNYAFAGTPLELLYGQNLDTLRQISAKYDPNGIMKLTGGFLF